jgi:hypothetical protein
VSNVGTDAETFERIVIRAQSELDPFFGVDIFQSDFKLPMNAAKRFDA